MEDLLFGAAVILPGLGGVLGIAYALDQRRKRRGSFGPKLPRAGRIGRSLWWGARVLAALMVMLIAAAYALHVELLAWATAGCAVLFFADHVAYRVVRLTGK